MLAGEVMFRNAKERLDGDIDADFFARFANGTLLERFEIVQLSADNAPATGFGRKKAQGQQDALVVVHQKHADADTRNRDGLRGGA